MSAHAVTAVKPTGKGCTCKGREGKLYKIDFKCPVHSNDGLRALASFWESLDVQVNGNVRVKNLKAKKAGRRKS
jgi:hypothetical protein